MQCSHVYMYVSWGNTPLSFETNNIIMSNICQKNVMLYVSRELQHSCRQASDKFTHKLFFSSDLYVFASVGSLIASMLCDLPSANTKLNCSESF